MPALYFCAPQQGATPPLHTMPEVERPARGLSAIRETRELREKRRGTATASGKFWIWSVVVIALLTIFYWKKTESENDAARARVLSKQRAIAEQLGAPFSELRDRLEGWTVDVAKLPTDAPDYTPKLEAPEGASPSLFLESGIYLRVLQPNAATKEKVRTATGSSIKDAFVACLLRTSQVVERTGRACRFTHQCQQGEICSELEECSPITQPFNLRMASRGLRMLSDTWIKDVQTTSEALRLRMFDADIDDASKNDLPLAADILKKAKYFLVVVDEVPADAKDNEQESLEQVVQASPHAARVAMYNLTTNALVFRARRELNAVFPVAAASVQAQKRQILNCGLGQDVRSALGLQ